METIRKGSRGEAVKTLQTKLGITADGIFGANTETAVKNFQREKGLVIDGIVGAKTWAALLGRNSEKPNFSDNSDIEIVPAYISTHITKSAGRKIDYIAVHYTAGVSSKAGSAKAVRNVFNKKESRGASADFAVDDATIVQINPDLRNYYCWSVGDAKNKYSSGGRLYKTATNKNTVSIEICSNLAKGANKDAANHAGWTFTGAALDNARKLIRYLMKKYNVPKANVVRHYDVSGKLCPGVLGWNDEAIYTTAGERTKEKNNSDAWQAFWESI